MKVFSSALQSGYGLHGVSKSEGFGFVIGLARTIITTGAQDLVTLGIQYHESTGTMSIGCSSIKLDMHGWSLNESGFRWEVDRLTKGVFGDLHIFYKLSVDRLVEC